MYSEHLQKYIPPNFDLDKYDKGAKMGLEDWLTNLSARNITYCASHKQFKGELDDKQKFVLQRINTDCIQNGVIINTPYSDMWSRILKDDTAEYAAVVKEITYFELFTMANKLKTGEIEKLYSEIDFSIFPLVNQNKLGELNNIFPVSDTNEEHLVWLEVDMDSTDSEITNAFSGWLQRARKKQITTVKNTKAKALKTFNQATFGLWNNARVLQYIDLVTWHNLRGNKITSKIIGDILFPDPKNMQDKTGMVNNTVKQYANQLTSIAILKRMLKVLADKNRKKIK